MVENIASSLGPSLRRLREGRRLTQEALAAAAGVKPETVHRAETGKVVPDLRTLERLLVAVGSNLADFFARVPGSAEALPADEAALLDAWRALDGPRRAAVLELVRLLASSNPSG